MQEVIEELRDEMSTLLARSVRHVDDETYDRLVQVFDHNIQVLEDVHMSLVPAVKVMEFDDEFTYQISRRKGAPMKPAITADNEVMTFDTAYNAFLAGVEAWEKIK